MTDAQELLDRADALLLDFDGPIAALMPPPANMEAADKARLAFSGLQLPPTVLTSTDHLTVLRYAIEEQPELAPAVEAACTEAEAGAARVCEPSIHARELLDLAQAREIPVGVVSNNSDRAVREFFSLHGWSHYVGAYACRTPETISGLKPSPFLLTLAADALRIDITRAVFIGDAVSDAIAGKAAGVPVIGLAKNDQRRAELLEAGANAVIDLRRSAG